MATVERPEGMDDAHFWHYAERRICGHPDHAVPEAKCVRTWGHADLCTGCAWDHQPSDAEIEAEFQAHLATVDKASGATSDPSGNAPSRSAGPSDGKDSWSAVAGEVMAPFYEAENTASQPPEERAWPRASTCSSSSSTATCRLRSSP